MSGSASAHADVCRAACMGHRTTDDRTWAIMTTSVRRKANETPEERQVVEMVVEPRGNRGAGRNDSLDRTKPPTTFECFKREWRHVCSAEQGEENVLTTWPKVYTPEAAPREVIALAEQLVPQMIVGDHPALEALRAQYDRARVASDELTGAGFYVNYEVPDDAPRATPPKLPRWRRPHSSGTRTPRGRLHPIRQRRAARLP